MKQPWLHNRFADGFFILLPPFACLLVIWLFPQLFQNTENMPVAGWVLLILLIDVGHVYSTLYRTYFDAQAYKKQKLLLLGIPFGAFVAGVLLYGFSSVWFWRALAYVAVFHFIRQQYGFMRLYARYEQKANWYARIDAAAVYAATVYPVVFWHLRGPRNFNWFIENDFFYANAEYLLMVFTAAYWIIMLVYLITLIISFFKKKHFNLPKLAIISGTAVGWYFGIIYFNGDMAFTLLNVVSHGIPYMALIWVHGRKTYAKPGGKNKFLQYIFSARGLLVFLLIIFLFAFVEEFLWDVTVWNEHRTVFGGNHFRNIALSKDALNLLVPLLAVPQLTHYILDGFIWKIRKDEIKWSGE